MLDVPLLFGRRISVADLAGGACSVRRHQGNGQVTERRSKLSGHLKTSCVLGVHTSARQFLNMKYQIPYCKK